MLNVFFARELGWQRVASPKKAISILADKIDNKQELNFIKWRFAMWASRKPKLSPKKLAKIDKFEVKSWKFARLGQILESSQKDDRQENAHGYFPQKQAFV